MFFVQRRLTLHICFYLYFVNCGCFNDNYCGPGLCGGNKTHVMCMYNSGTPSHRCLNYKKIIDEKEKVLVLDKINERRNRIASGVVRSLPSARDMQKLSWNDDLAAFAQRWADQCVERRTPDVKDNCRDLDNTASVGQSVATVYGESPGLNAMALVDLWFSELLNVKGDVINDYAPSEDLHLKHFDYFTQLVWSNSVEVGCGGVKFTEIEDRSNHTVYRLVCNFAPGGNRKGAAVYEAGTPCSQCRSGGGCDRHFDSLCIASDSNEHNQTTMKENEEVVTKLERDTEHVTQNDDDVEFSYHPLLEYYKSRDKITTMEHRCQTCGNVDMDELVELLRKKISGDIFKEMLFATKAYEPVESNFTDSAVYKFVSQIYSNKKSTATTKTTENENVNSTILAELIGAVIFKQPDQIPVTRTTDFVTPSLHPVNPVKIQAALPSTEKGQDFAGHLFFPEDVATEETDDEADTDTTETYYDTEVPISDVISELENLKRTYQTKSFLDEILESELVTEDITTHDDMTETKNPYEHLADYMKEHEIGTEQSSTITQGDEELPFQERKRRDNFDYPIQKTTKDCIKKLYYDDLLQKISQDINRLQLHQIFSCSSAVTINRSMWFFPVPFVTYYFFYCMYYEV